MSSLFGITPEFVLFFLLLFQGEFALSFEEPTLSNLEPSYTKIEPDQAFVALPSFRLNLKSFLDMAYFEIDGVPERVPIKLIQSPQRETILQAAIENKWEWKEYRKVFKELKQLSSAQKKKVFTELVDFVVFGTDRRFPENSKIILHIPAGILSDKGIRGSSPQKFEFETIEPFVANFNCERTQANRPCNPVLNMQLHFTGQLPSASLMDAKLMTEDGRTWRPVENSIDHTKATSKVKDDNFIDTLNFIGPFPEKTAFKMVLPNNLKDELGRKLSNQAQFPLKISTDEYSPLIKFAAPFGVLELKGDPIIPVSIRNVEPQIEAKQLSIDGRTIVLSDLSKIKTILDLYLKIVDKDSTYSKRNISILSQSKIEEKTEKIEFSKNSENHELELIGIPAQKSGFHVVELKSPKLGETLTESRAPMYVTAGVLVTDLSVHFKKGRESSLIWVTRLSDAQPVKGATVLVADSLGNILANGTTDTRGIFNFDSVVYPCSKLATDSISDSNGELDETDQKVDGQTLNSNDSEKNQKLKKGSCEVFAFAQKETDLSFTSSQWSKGIEPYRFNIYFENWSKRWGPSVSHTILNRTIAQVGDRIEMKHILRDHSITGFKLANESKLPKRVFIVHEGSQKTYTLPFEYNPKTGSAVNAFSIPKDALLGRYSIYLSSLPGPESRAIRTGEFSVAEYRLPVINALIKVQDEPLIHPKTVLADLSAHYLSGGPAQFLKVKVRGSVQPGYFPLANIPNGSDYSLFDLPLVAGVFDSEVRARNDTEYLNIQNLSLNNNGGNVAKLSNIPSTNQLQNLLLEIEYLDPNGEFKTTSTSSLIFPARRIIGLRTENWYVGRSEARVHGIVVDIHGNPLPKVPYTVQAFNVRYITHRKKLIGGFYSYDSKTEVIAFGKICGGITDEMGAFICSPKKLPVGSVTLQAKVTDAELNSTYASTQLTVFEKGVDTWWVPSDSDRIDFIPERVRYEPNQKAKFILRSPFQRGTALITVEREGIIDTFVTEINRDNSMVEIPIKPNYAPNVFVSILLLRGRLDSPRPSSLLDLAKPSMKMGLAEIKVGWRTHELKVELTPEKFKFHTRDKVKVHIQVRDGRGNAPATNAEIAVVAEDEALLRLKENTSWKLLDTMMGQRPLSVVTSSSQNQVVGKRHFGAKAKSPGGDGGFGSISDLRQLFEPVLLWNPILKLDSKGEADIVVPLNDSITAFRIVAIATAAEGQFGTGMTRVEASKDLIIHSGFPPLAREGDIVHSQFTVRNTTSREMKVNIEVLSKDFSHLPKFSNIELRSNESRTFEVPLNIPSGKQELRFDIKARDVNSGRSDSLASKISVESANLPRIVESHLFQLEKHKEIAIAPPTMAGKEKGLSKGEIAIQASASLVSGLSSVKSYMESYPFTCLEQKISRAIAIQNLQELESLIQVLPNYLDQNGLLKFFPRSTCGSPLLTHYILNILQENSLAIPENTLRRILDGVQLTLAGRNRCSNELKSLSPLSGANLNPIIGSDEVRVLLFDSQSRYKNFLPAQLATIRVEPNLWKNETLIAWINLLGRQKDIPNHERLLREAEKILYSKIDFRGEVASIQSSSDPTSDGILFSSKDQEFIGVVGLALDGGFLGEDLTKLVRGFISRLNRGHFDTTLANAWAVTFLRKFSMLNEIKPIRGDTKIFIGDSNQTIHWQTDKLPEKILYNWPLTTNKASLVTQFSHLGDGKPWMEVQAKAVLPATRILDHGYQISRRVKLVSRNFNGPWQSGDVANIELTITSNFDQAWVVIRDPIPTGATHLNSDFDDKSKLLEKQTLSKNSEDSVKAEDWPTEFLEKSIGFYTNYASYLPRGTYRINYRIRLNSTGTFVLPSTRVEAMYNSEFIGEEPNQAWKVNSAL